VEGILQLAAIFALLATDYTDLRHGFTWIDLVSGKICLASVKIRGL
jgi:hypothetical protein